jgi:hypothetical protein
MREMPASPTISNMNRQPYSSTLYGFLPHPADLIHQLHSIVKLAAYPIVMPAYLATIIERGGNEDGTDRESRWCIPGGPSSLTSVCECF